jgi:hypothetical protein
MLRITKEKIYLEDIDFSREFVEKNLEIKFDADFICIDEEKSFKVTNSNQSSLSEEDNENVKYLLANKDRIISDYQESIKEPDLDLEHLKLQKISAAENYRKYLQFLPINYNGVELSTSEMARQNILTNILILDSSTKKYWRDESNASCEFDINNFKEITTLISERDSKLYSIEAEIKNIITNEVDNDSLKSLEISSLWSDRDRNYRKSTTT